MSLILEALRKSEAERRRGELPGLHAELPPARPLRDGPPAWMWFALALGFAAALVLVWSARGLWLQPARAIPQVALQSSPPIAAPAGTVAPAASVADHTRAPTVPNAPVDIVSARPTAPAIPEPAFAVVEPAPLPPTPAMPKPAADPSSPPRVAVTLADAPVRAPRPVPDASPQPPASLTTAMPRPPSVEMPPPAAMPRTADDVGPAGDAGGAAPIALAALGASERRTLPALKISMHMWNATPAQRFVIIDGSRVTEGSRVGDAVVEQITRDGVLLAWQGRRLLLPIR